MTEKLFIFICEIALGIAAVSGVGIILAATWYDLRSIRQKGRLQALVKKLHKSRQPFITILVYAYNNAATIKTCLQSINHNRYAHYRIIVIDNASTDTTKQIVSNYQRSHSKVALTIRSRRRPIDRSALLHLTYDKLPESDLILQINATDLLPPMLLKNSATRFIANNKLGALRLRPSPSDELSITTLPHHFFLLSRSMIYKSIAPFSVALRHINDSDGIIKRSLSSTELPPAEKLISSYASTLALVKPASVRIQLRRDTAKNIVRTFNTPLIRFLKFICLSSLIVILTYFLYTAAILQSNILLVLSWFALSLWLLATIWSDEVIKVNQKIELTLSVPFMYFLFYVQMIAYCLRILWETLIMIPVPDISHKNMRRAIQKELYSTQY